MRIKTLRMSSLPETASQRSTRSIGLILVAALVPLIVFALVIIVTSLQEKQSALQREALTETSRILALVDAELERQLTLLAALARSPTLDQPPDFAAFAELLQRELAAQPLW